MAQSEAGRGELLAVAEEARRKIDANARDADAYRALGRALRRLGSHEEAQQAELGAIEASQHDPETRRAAQALVAGDLPTAEAVLRAILARRPDDVAAARMLADVAIQSGHVADAEKLARYALNLAPGFEYARFTLATALDRLGHPAEALAELSKIVESYAEQPSFLVLKAETLAKLGRSEAAIAAYRDLTRIAPQDSTAWIALGNLLRIEGDDQGAVDAYRNVLKTSPTDGEAWWSLANLKTLPFDDDDVAAMQAALKTGSLPDDQRAQLHFALGKALEDRGEDERSFRQYKQGNAIRLRTSRYDPAASTRLIEEMERVFAADFLAAHAQDGCQASDPIFILGLTRSGSTLIEQILASHSQVEGTGELPEIILAAKGLEQARPNGATGGWRNYPEILRDLAPADFRHLGETYLARTRTDRKTDRPFFIDKMPNNWFHIGLIRLIVPNARIIDARRHPLACGFSNFKQYYAAGQEFTYDLDHFGRYYRDYVRLMAHFDQVSPGAVYRVLHERLLADPETEIRKLLQFLNLPFEDACLRFYETRRSVRTVSAQQVRRPIDASQVDQWKRFERWLGPLKRALGPALEEWDRGSAAKA
ncbi:MAG TPA: sulfotransferase [Sphingomicrobium sp.]